MQRTAQCALCLVSLATKLLGTKCSAWTPTLATVIIYGSRINKNQLTTAMDLQLEICKNIHINNLHRDNNGSVPGHEDSTDAKDANGNQYSVVSCIDWYNNEEVYFIM